MLNSLPSLFRRPVRVVGTPVAFAILRFADVKPDARFHEKDKPGTVFLLAIKTSSFAKFILVKNV